MSGSTFGGFSGLLHTLVHNYTPHTPADVYLLSMIGALLFVGAGYALALSRNRVVAPETHIANLGSGSSFPVYLLMPLVPFDEHLLAPLAQSWFTVALAGFIGAGVTLRSLWRDPQAAATRSAAGHPAATRQAEANHTETRHTETRHAERWQRAYADQD